MPLRRRLLESEFALRAGRKLPAPVREVLKSIVLGRPRPRWGNLRRTSPFSERFGADRGTPIDRIYIEDFLARHAGDVRGETLEVKDPGYTRRFGGSAVTKSDVLDVRPDNPEATIVADLGERGSLPAARFDCFILTQTLEYVPEPAGALANAWQALRPGGVLLVTVPTITRVDWVKGQEDLWRWTPAGLERLLAQVLPEAETEVRGHGNLLAATAFLLGLAAEELDQEQLRLFDPLFVILSSARVRKPSA